jgi:signal transduction histidine kinase
MSLELREGDINKLITQMMEFAGYEMEQSNITCRLQLDEKLPNVLMDERYVKQAFLNLVTNARSAMPRGGSFTITTKHVESEAVITISDTGTGISEKNIPKIFEPYFTTRETGTGLGLTQVYKIIKEHQGEINVNSKPGKGTDFEIILPIPQKERRMIEYAGTEGE